MTRVKRYPTAQLPRTDRRFGAGVMLAAALHVVAVIALVVSLSVRYELGTAQPGAAGGGGGGGGGRSVRYVQLPASAGARSATTSRVSAAAAIENAEPPPPSVETERPPEPTPVTDADPATLFDQRTTSLLTLGPGTGSGLGPGSGAGIGGGTGTGSGTGIGSGTGPGIGDGGAVYAPEPRAVIYPHEAPPVSIRGRLFRIRFWVDARGRVDRVDIEPEIEDVVFRRTLVERVSSWTFYPARTIDGKPVAGQLVITYSP